MGMSIRAYARHRGVSDTAVHKAIRTGRIQPEADGTIDPERADREWQQNTQPIKVGTAWKGTGNDEDWPALASSTPSGPSLLQARTINETIKAQTNKVRLARMKGELVDRNQAIAQVFRLARIEGLHPRAIELGLREIGFSDHNPLPRGLAANVRMREDELDYYVSRVLDLQFQYRGKIDVLLGLEMDYLEGLEAYLETQLTKYPWDYVIGSIHYLDPECRVGSWPRAFDGATADLYARYFDLMRKLARSGLCDIIAHFDVPKRAGHRTEQANDDLPAILEEIKRADVCVEINTAGYRHPELPAPEPYPGLAIVEQLLALGVPLTVNSDAHAPDQVGLESGAIESFLRRKGCTRLAKFEHRKRSLYEL